MNIEIFYLLISGFFGGVLAGMLGVGGGVIYILILPIALSSAGVCEADLVKYTIANSVFSIFVASLSGIIVNIVKGQFYIKQILKIGLPAAIFSIISMILIVSQSWYSKGVFNGMVIILLSVMLLKMLLSKKKFDAEKQVSTSSFLKIGSVSGVISALSGLGGGILIVPLLEGFFNMPIKKAKDISMGVVGLMAFCLSIYNLSNSGICVSNEFQIGLIVFPTVLTMVIGVAFGSPTGVWVSNKLQPNHIKIIFMLLITFVILRKVTEIFI